LLAFLLVSGEQTFAATFAIEQMARKNDGACANPKPIRTDVDGRRPDAAELTNSCWQDP
jgi:hypothetical protein